MVQKTIENKTYVITDSLRVKQFIAVEKLREEASSLGLTNIEVGYKIVPILVESIDGETDKQKIVEIIDGIGDIEAFHELVEIVTTIVLSVEKKKVSDTMSTVNE